LRFTIFFMMEISTAKRDSGAKLYVLIICYLIFIGLFACEYPNSQKKVNTDHIQYNPKFIRFDKALFALDTNHMMQSIDSLGSQYPDFASVYFQEITGLSAKGDSTVFKNSVLDFITDKDYKGMMDTVLVKYPNTQELDKAIVDLCKHIKFYFPEKPLGDVYYFVSGLNRWSAVTVDSNIAVGLDMHLGRNYPYYASVSVPAYQTARCEPQYIPVNIAKSVFEDMFATSPDGKNLLQMMIDKGKQLVFAEYCLPNEKDEILIGYTEAQLAWCKENEAMIWYYLSNQKLLYSTQWQEILRYVSDGPNSTGMPPESPGNIGSWVGWQLVRTYLKNNSNVKWTDLMKDNTDPLTFLRASKYKPN